MFEAMPNEDWSDREIDDGGRGERAVDRELERLKRLYKQHADTLAGLASTAPTKALARKYGDLITEINRSILGLEDPGAIVSRASVERPIEPPPAAMNRPAMPSGSALEVNLRTEPGRVAAPAEPEPNPLGRIVVILVMAILVVVVLAVFIWKYGGDEQVTPATVSPPAAESQPDVSAATAPLPGLRVTPEAQDYGIVNKGTRVAKPFEVTNTSDRSVTLEIERSKCRCLWFDHPPVVPAGGKVTLVISVDGALAEPGLVSEAVVISMKEPPRQATEVQITAEVR